MGCSSSKHSVEEANPIDARLVRALKVAKKQRAKNGKSKEHKTFDQLLMKFPKMIAGFKKSRELFAQLDANQDGLVDLKEWQEGAKTLGLTDTEGVLAEIFGAVDMDQSKAIDVMEFVLVFVIIHLLYPEKAGSLDTDIIHALEIVEDFFCAFDASSDGYLEQAEMERAMKGTNESGSDNHQVAASLFAQLDWDGNGHISFKEFLLGLEKMAMEEVTDEA